MTQQRPFIKKKREAYENVDITWEKTYFPQSDPSYMYENFTEKIWFDRKLLSD